MPNENSMSNLPPWILNDGDEAYIATDYLHIIEGRRACWKCKKQTRVIGLGIGEYVQYL